MYQQCRGRGPLVTVVKRVQRMCVASGEGTVTSKEQEMRKQQAGTETEMETVRKAR
jgi:hypothetical protein